MPSCSGSSLEAVELHPQERVKRFLGYICKAVNSGYNNYVIFVSQINLSPFGPILELDWCQVIFVFLSRFLLPSIFKILPIQLLEENS